MSKGNNFYFISYILNRFLYLFYNLIQNRKGMSDNKTLIKYATEMVSMLKICLDSVEKNIQGVQKG